MEPVRGGITAPCEFSASGVSCGIKRRGKDLALIFSGHPAVVAGTLTANRLKAPSILWAEQVLRRKRAQAIVANSGNANSCTGWRGMQDTREMARASAKELGIDPSMVLVASTGIIGHSLPMEKVRQGIRRAAGALSRIGSLPASEAIMTTDTRHKEVAVRFRVGSRPVTVGGIAKGSGMISPQMATMLAFLTTDARVDARTLQGVIRSVVPGTFNSITVDGETSTNDMVILLANGASGAPPIAQGTGPYRRFLEAVRTVSEFLAYEIVRDGEGVNRLLVVEVSGASDHGSGTQVARRVANSLLVKTMVAGRDPNWGRVAAAVGSSGAAVDPRRLVLRLGNLTVFRKGEPVPAARKALLAEMDKPEVRIWINLGRGSANAQVVSGDLTEEYVRINAKYTS